MNILFEDRHILVCEKPSGVPTQAGKVTEKDMLSEVNNHLKKAGENSPAYIIHRLDKPVRGILVFAKTKQAAALLNSELTDTSSKPAEKTPAESKQNNKTSSNADNNKSKSFIKHYTAIVEGLFDDNNKSGILKNYL